MPTRQREPNRFAVTRTDLTSLVADDVHTRLGKPVCVVVEIFAVANLPPHVVQAIGRFAGQNDRVMLLLIPTLQEDPILLAGGLIQADDFCVIGGRQLQVRNPDLDMR